MLVCQGPGDGYITADAETLEADILNDWRADDAGLRIGDSPQDQVVGAFVSCELGELADREFLSASLSLVRGRDLGVNPLRTFAALTVSMVSPTAPDSASHSM